MYMCDLLGLFVAERKIRNVNQRSDLNTSEGTKSRVNTFKHHTSKVTYGGIDGAYYTSSRTRRAGSDGVRRLSFRILSIKRSFTHTNRILFFLDGG